MDETNSQLPATGTEVAPGVSSLQGGMNNADVMVETTVGMRERVAPDLDGTLGMGQRARSCAHRHGGFVSGIAAGTGAHGNGNDSLRGRRWSVASHRRAWKLAGVSEGK